jgi:carbonic anhydrase
LERLKQGNRRFVTGARDLDTFAARSRRDQLLSRQDPVAVIVGCSDSRVPVEMVFDQGLGDLFVIRVAGHVVAPSQIGSVEFAAEYLGTRLVVVLGHTRCGAIDAALASVERADVDPPGSLGSIVDRVRPSVEEALADGAGDDREALLRRAMRANVRASVAALEHGSEVLERRIANDGLLVVGAEYALETGVVDFFHGLPDVAASPASRPRDPGRAGR